MSQRIDKPEPPHGNAADLLNRLGWITQIGAAPSFLTVWSQLEALVELFGLTAVHAFEFKRGGDRTAISPLHSNTCNSPIEWANRDADSYLDRLAHDVSTFTISEFAARPTAVRPNWSEMLAMIFTGGDGLIVPVTGGAQRLGFVAFMGPSPELSPLSRSVLHVAAYSAFMRATGLKYADAVHANARNGSRFARLSPRERECLNWLSLGKQDAEIASVLGISQRTVRFHVNNAKFKLGAATRVEAVAKALRT